MTDPQSQNPIIVHKQAQIAEFEQIAIDLEGFADRATPDRAAVLLDQAGIARRQVLQLQIEIDLIEKCNQPSFD